MSDPIIDFAKPIFYNDDVFGRLYNQRTAAVVGKCIDGKYQIRVGRRPTDFDVFCDERGFEEGANEPSVFNGD